MPDSSSASKENGTSDEGEDHRIVGGRPAKPGEVPYQISLILDNEHDCGASLVVSPSTGTQFALTAAHCVTDLSSGTNALKRYPSEWKVRAGSVDRYRGETLKVANIIVHEQWTGQMQFDIAVIFFHGSFRLSTDIYPIDLPKQNHKIERIHVSGWGYLHENDYDAPRLLQTVTLPVVSIGLCNQIWQEIIGGQSRGRPAIDRSNLCAGFEEGGKDACQGDSGGPAVVDGRSGKFLVGIVSFGEGCAQPGIPGVFTRVWHYLNWIWRAVGYYEHQSGSFQNRNKRPTTLTGRSTKRDGNKTEPEIKEDAKKKETTTVAPKAAGSTKKSKTK